MLVRIQKFWVEQMMLAGNNASSASIKQLRIQKNIS